MSHIGGLVQRGDGNDRLFDGHGKAADEGLVVVSLCLVVDGVGTRVGESGHGGGVVAVLLRAEGELHLVLAVGGSGLNNGSRLFLAVVDQRAVLLDGNAGQL